MDLQLNELPEDNFWKRQAEKNREYIRENAYEDEDGILRWKTKDNPIPESTFREAYVEQPEGQVEARRKHTDEVLRKYRENYTPPSEEQKAEMRAAFGEGETVVNAITGERIEL